MTGALRRTGLVAFATFTLCGVGVPVAHADGLDDFDVGGIIEDLSVLTEVGMWPEADAEPARPPTSDVEPPAADADATASGAEPAVPGQRGTAANDPSLGSTGMQPMGLPETGARTAASRTNLTLVAGLATVMAGAGLTLRASGRALSRRPRA